MAFHEARGHVTPEFSRSVSHLCRNLADFWDPYAVIVVNGDFDTALRRRNGDIGRVVNSIVFPSVRCAVHRKINEFGGSFGHLLQVVSIADHQSTSDLTSRLSRSIIDLL